MTSWEQETWGGPGQKSGIFLTPVSCFSRYRNDPDAGYSYPVHPRAIGFPRPFGSDSSLQQTGGSRYPERPDRWADVTPSPPAPPGPKGRESYGTPSRLNQPMRVG